MLLAAGYGRTALQAAAGGGHLEVVEKLLAAGADVNAAAGLWTDRAASRSWRRPSRGGRDAASSGADVNATAAGDGRTALQAAAESGHQQVVNRLKAAGVLRR